MSYQGVLLDSDGQPVPGDDYPVSFAIYDVDEGGTALRSEYRTISVAGGLFEVDLGDETPLSLVVFEGSPRYLGITVDTDPEQTPRTKLTSVPFAFRAASAPAIGEIRSDSSWVCRFHESWRSGEIYLRLTKIYFHNPNDLGTIITLSFYDFTGGLLDQCEYVIGSHTTWFWNSQNPEECVNAAPDGSAKWDWFSIESTLPVAPRDHYIFNPTNGPVFGVPLGFWAK